MNQSRQLKMVYLVKEFSYFFNDVDPKNRLNALMDNFYDSWALLNSSMLNIKF